MIVQTEPLYRCDICGHVAKWDNETWTQIVCALGTGYRGWEHAFHVCSDKCDDEFRKLSKKAREKLYLTISI